MTDVPVTPEVTTDTPDDAVLPDPSGQPEDVAPVVEVDHS